MKLGIPDFLYPGPRSVEEIASECAVLPDILSRFLSVLVTEEILHAEADGRLTLTALGVRLRTNPSGGLADWIITVCEEQFIAWGHILHTLRTGRPAFERAFGVNFWEYLKQNEPAAESYDAGMAGTIREACELVINKYDFTGVRNVVDVGGGRGVLARALLRTHPSLAVTLVDLPDVARRAEKVLGNGDIGKRCVIVPGSFLDDVPKAQDLYILCRVLADWDDSRAKVILATCRRAMAPGSRLLIIEGLARPQAAAGARGMLDLHLLLLIGGRERSEAELSALLFDSGFDIRSVIHADDGRVSLIEAVARQWRPPIPHRQTAGLHT